MPNVILRYDPRRWVVKKTAPFNTLQLFITNRCNYRCRGCFYQHKLGQTQMSLGQYRDYIWKYLPQVQKVILLGGEPTLHPDLPAMIKFNQQNGLLTTIYSNGFNLKILQSLNLKGVKIRVGVYGAYGSEKPLSRVPKTDLPLTIVYMLRRDNVLELFASALMAEKNFNCQGFYISSIRDIEATQDYWEDTPETIPLDEYAQIIQNFVDNYQGHLSKIHLATRGVLITKNNDFSKICHCRFGNIFPDEEKIICPLDISKKLVCPELIFNQRTCTKHYKCILQKIVLERL